MWQIVPQVDKDSFVEIKEVKCFPKKKKRPTDKQEFIIIKPHKRPLSVWIEHQLGGGIWKITKSKHGYNITCPKRLVPVNAWSNEMKEVDGRAFNGRAKSGTMTFTRFQREITELCGVEFASKVIGLFEQYLEAA